MNPKNEAASEMNRDENHRIWAVGSLILAIGDAISGRFNPVRVEGEIGSWTTASSGHCYFTLKDDGGQLRCAMFKRHAAFLEHQPKEGDWVRVSGRLDVYPARGDLQLIVESLTAAGQGMWYEKFLELQKKLQSQGLFDPLRKRAIPSHPKHVAIVSSLEAAALRDVCVTLKRRAPHVHVTVFPTLVQGPLAPSSLIKALQSAQSHSCDLAGPVQLVLLVRGGGSLEDLWSFNDEDLAHTIAASKVPVISGIGHETDFTIADFVSDLRAPTPTAAAELCCVALTDELKHLEHASRVMLHALQRKRHQTSQAIVGLQLRLSQPNRHWIRHQQRLDETHSQMLRAIKSYRHDQQLRVHGYATTLQSLHPQRVLERGYAWVTTEDDERLVTRASSLRPHDRVNVRFSDGTQSMTVNPDGSSNLPRMGD